MAGTDRTIQAIPMPMATALDRDCDQQAVPGAQFSNDSTLCLPWGSTFRTNTPAGAGNWIIVNGRCQ